MKERISEIPVQATKPVVFVPVTLTDDELCDKNYLRNLAMRELVAIVQANRGEIKGIGAVKELLDRSEGRTTQVIHQVNENIDKTIPYELSNEHLISELKKLSALNQLPDGVLLLEDGTLTIDN